MRHALATPEFVAVVMLYDDTASPPAGHPVGGLHVGGGGGTVVPPLSRQAGLCLHPVARMRGVLFVHEFGRILVAAHPGCPEPAAL